MPESFAIQAEHYAGCVKCTERRNARVHDLRDAFSPSGKAEPRIYCLSAGRPWLGILIAKSIVKLMSKLLISVVMLNLLLCKTLAAPSAVDVAGTYRLESMTQRGQTVPTNFIGITITLNSNGTFNATNVPRDFLFESSSNSALSSFGGTWDEQNAGKAGGVFLNVGTPTGSNSCLMLIKSDFGTSRIFKKYHPGGRDSVEVYLGKQNGGNSLH